MELITTKNDLVGLNDEIVSPSLQRKIGLLRKPSELAEADENGESSYKFDDVFV